MAGGIIGVATIDVRARLTGFQNQLRAGVESELAATSTAFVRGGAGVARSAAAMESGLKARLAGFVRNTGLAELGSQVNRSMTAIGVPLKVALPAAAAIVGYESIKMAGNFQSQMNLMVTAAGEARGAIGKMSDQVLQIARDTGTNTTELTSGLYSVEKAGYRAGDATHVLGIAAEGARAEGASLSAVVAGMTSVMASYHVPASSAVTVMNQIIAAAGESKTTMENFSSALSTVIPIASVAHVSFAEVGGAIATLTQHGTSAAESTQELSNLLRNLQAPNQVAQKAMQQLGIGVNDLEKGLGNPQIGLTGTITRLVSTITRNMGPAGLVMYNAFKQSQSASQDLNTMIAHMSPPLAKLSQQYIDGQLSFTKYRTGFRGLGAEGAAQGAQFLSLANTVKGFNDYIKTGQPGSQTFVNALKNMVGGATGLNTVLQLTGGSLNGFNERTQRIADAAKKAGDHVMSWSNVQKSFNVQMSRLHEVISTAMISLGERLIPALGKAATATADWLGHLGDGGSVFADTQKKFGPLAGAVDVLHTAFQRVGQLWTTVVVPGAKDLWTALQPLLQAMQRGAETALHFANDALNVIGAIIRNVVMPAVLAVTGYFRDHAAAIAHAAVTVAQFLGVLGGVGLVVRGYALAVGVATAATSLWATTTAVLSLGFTALRGGEIVAFIGLFTKSTIAATIATGAQTVATVLARTAMIAWGVAMAAFRAVSLFLIGGGFVEAIRVFVVESRIAAAATWLWTAAQTALDVAMDANPIGLLVIAVAALVAAIVAVVTHFQNLKNVVGDVFSTLGAVIHDVVGAMGGFVDVVKGIFTLDWGTIEHGLLGIGKSILSIPLDVLKGVGQGLADLFGIDTKPIKIPFVVALSTAQMQSASNQAAIAIGRLSSAIDHTNYVVSHASLSTFSDTIAKSIAQVQGASRELSTLQKTVGGTTVVVGSLGQAQKVLAGSMTAGNSAISRSGYSYQVMQANAKAASVATGGVTVSMKQWNKALQDTHGNQTAAVALIKQMVPNLNAYRSEITLLKTEQTRFNTAIDTTGKTLNLSKDDVIKYGTFLGYTGQQVVTGASAQRKFSDAVDTARYVIGNAHGAVGTLITQLFTYQNSAKTAADQTDLFKTALDALAGNTQDVNTAIAQANTQVSDLGSSLAGMIPKGKTAGDTLFSLHGHAIKLTGSGAQLQVGMSQLKTQLENVATATLQSGGSWQDATNAYDNAVKNTLPQLASKLHLSSSEVATLNNFLSLTPAEKKVLLSMPGLTESTGGMSTLLNYLNNLPGQKTVDIGVHYSVTGNPGTQLATVRGLSGVSAAGNIYRSFANGMERHVASIAAPTLRIWAEPETGGEAYIPLANSKRERSASILSTVARMFGGRFVPRELLDAMHVRAFASGGVSQSSLSSSVSSVISNVGSTYSTPINISQTGLARVVAQIHAAQAALASAIRHGLSPSAAQPLQDKITSLISTVNYQLSNLRIKIRTGDWDAIHHAMFTNAADLQTAFHTIFADLSAAGASSSVVRYALSTERQLLAVQAQRISVTTRLAAATTALADVTQKYHDAADAVKNQIYQSFDITTAGNFGGFSNIDTVLAGLTAQSQAATTFSADIAALSKTGLNKNLVSQLANAGPSALSQVQSLLSATPAQIAQINALQSSVISASQATGRVIADQMYGAGVDAARGLVAGLQSQSSALQKAMVRLADSLVAELKKALDAHSPSRRTRLVGQMAGIGPALGIVDMLPHVEAAARRLGDAAVPRVPIGAAASGPRGLASVTINNYVTAPPGMSVEQLALRVSVEQARRVRMNTLVPTGG